MYKDKPLGRCTEPLVQDGGQKIVNIITIWSIFSYCNFTIELLVVPVIKPWTALKKIGFKMADKKIKIKI